MLSTSIIDSHSVLPVDEDTAPHSNDGNKLLLIIGATVGGIVVGGLVIVVLVMMVFIVIRMKRRRYGKDKKTGNDNIHNPTYTGERISSL